jgi:general secretion pathway protein E
MPMLRARLAPLDPIPPDPQPIATGLADFVSHLARKHAITGDLLTQGTLGRDRGLRAVWELTELSASDFADEVAVFYRLRRVDLPQLLAATPATARLSSRFLREALIYPCTLADDAALTLVVADPTDTGPVHGAALALGAQPAIAVGSIEDITTALAKNLGVEELPRSELAPVATTQGEDDIDSLRDLASGAPVVRALNDLLDKAVDQRATDIHVEPFRTGLVIRFRVDGLLRSIQAPSNVLPQALLSRIKILAGLNIAERRLPQDGAAHLRIGRSDMDIRVATMPTQHGEAAVIRLLPRDRGDLELAKLGLSDAHQHNLQGLLGLPHGIVIVTGPTSSGKTTTLATLLTALNDTTRKILTIEDPVEYEIRGVNQSQVKPEIGLTFATALRAFVRQDPDVIMVGEVRDSETANIAIHAALTGHLVLTTLHTETAAAAVPRLLDLGVEGFLLRSTLRAVIAQRLARVLCDRCKIERTLTADDVASDPRYDVLGLHADDVIHEPRSCERCSGTGYRGRSGIFEILPITDQVRDLIGVRADSTAIQDAARHAGMTTMFEHGVAKCRAGLTSAAEVLRVTTVR